MDHSEVPVSASDARAAVPGLLQSMDSPTFDGFNSWLVCRAAKEAGLVVALSGLGGDELFAGYSTFKSVPRLRSLLKAVNVMPAPMRRSAASVMRRSARTRPLARALQGGEGMAQAYHLMRRIFGDDDLAAIGLQPPALSCIPGSLGDLDTVTLLELGSYLSDQLLRDADTTSMAHSIELRVPLLDDRIVETALALPESIRRNGKELLVKAAGLTSIAPKRPFALPMEGWISTSLNDIVRDALLDDSLPFSDTLPTAFRANLWQQGERKEVHWSKLWAVAVLRLWPDANAFRA
jgi:asparagine synthase (glutamine-hydrolysing)